MKWLNINTEEMITINIKPLDFKSFLNTMGIDIGQSLTKIAYIDIENNLNLKTFVTHTDHADIKQYLKKITINPNKFNFTGGKAFNLYHEFLNQFEANIFDEFQSNIKGIEILYFLSKKKNLSDSLILNIGTGTSIVLKKETIKHIGGSALGGGFFMGIIKLLFGMNDYYEAIKLANKGNRYNIDLKVSDIYDPKDQRVDTVFRELTAASFAKIAGYMNPKSIKREDIINSLICLIGENIGTIANLSAINNNVDNIVFSGGFLKDNNVLRRILDAISKMNKKKAIFLKNAEFCGAIGALLS